MTTQVAKLFTHAGGQAVRLPAGFRFEGEEVYVRRDLRTGDVILSSRPEMPWLEFMALRQHLGSVPTDVLCDRVQGTQGRDPLESWVE